MSMFKIKVEGIDKVVDNINKYNDEIQDKIKQVLADGGIQIQREAQSRAPVKTGRLRNSIETRTSGDMQVEVVATVEYAAFVEFGTRNQEAQPYITPAFELVAPQVVRDIEEVLRK